MIRAEIETKKTTEKSSETKNYVDWALRQDFTGWNSE